MIRYLYRDKIRQKWVGYFECDEEDFKKMWQLIRDEVEICYVRRGKNRDEITEQYQYIGKIGWERIL